MSDPAPPADGRANAAVLALVAEAFGVKEAAVTIVSGPTSRTKRVRVAGVGADDARTALERLLSGQRPPAGGTTRSVDRPRRVP